MENFTAFDQVETAAVGDACAEQLRGVTAAFEAAWDAGGAQKQSLLDLFGTPADFTRGDMAWMLADSAAMGPQYGFKADMCGYVVGTVPATYPDLLTAFAAWTADHYGPDFGASCYYSTACLSDPARAAEWADNKPWVWQCCHELEYWQVAYPGSLRSSALTLDYFLGQCGAAFGAGYPAADVTAFNAEYQVGGRGGRGVYSGRRVACAAAWRRAVAAAWHCNVPASQSTKSSSCFLAQGTLAYPPTRAWRA